MITASGIPRTASLPLAYARPFTALLPLALRRGCPAFQREDALRTFGREWRSHLNPSPSRPSHCRRGNAVGPAGAAGPSIYLAGWFWEGGSCQESCQSAPCPVSGASVRSKTTSRFAAIAQLVEHVIRNDGVGGSNPSCGTTSYPPTFSTVRYQSSMH